MTRPSISFEFFPPKSLQASFRLWECVKTLAPMDPAFVSVTYGAGDTTNQLTHDTVDAIVKSSDLQVAAHLTCIDATRHETLAIAADYNASGVNYIVALRGDPPKGSSDYRIRADGFQSSIELTAALANKGFDVTVGAYPESHPNASNKQTCIDYLKAKIDAGATRAITQFFFEANTFLRFRDACADAGITAPILPGILPIENWEGVQKFAVSCGVAIPKVIKDDFAKANDPDMINLLSKAHATELCDDLLSNSVDHMHFYTLNKHELTHSICHALGITPDMRHQKVA